MNKEIKDKLAEIMFAGAAPDDAIYCAFWTDGPAGFNGLKELRGKKGNAVRAVYQKGENGGDLELITQVAGGKATRDGVVDFLDALMAASAKAADDAGVTIDETGGKIDAECLGGVLDIFKAIDAELVVDFIGTDEKFDGGGMLYQYRLGRDGSVVILGKLQEASAEFRKAADYFFREVLKNGDPFTLDRLIKQVGDAVKADDAPLYSLFWTARDNPIDALRKIKTSATSVVRIEFRGEGLDVDEAAVAAGAPVRKAAAGILFELIDPAPGDENKGRAKLDDEGLDSLLQTFKDRGLVYVMDLLGDADFDKGGELYVFGISRAGLVGIGRGSAGIRRDLATVYKNATDEEKKSHKWTPSVVRAKKGRAKK